jgi:hypothetical protein
MSSVATVRPGLLDAEPESLVMGATEWKLTKMTKKANTSTNGNVTAETRT